MTNIHKTAVVSPKSNIDSSVEIGAYSIIGDDVEIGKNTKIESHVVIKGKTKIDGVNYETYNWVLGLASGVNILRPGLMAKESDSVFVWGGGGCLRCERSYNGNPRGCLTGGVLEG